MVFEEKLGEYVASAREAIGAVSGSDERMTTYAALEEINREWRGKKEALLEDGAASPPGVYGLDEYDGDRMVQWTYGEPGNEFWNGEDWLQVSEGYINNDQDLQKIHFTSGDAEDTARVASMLQKTFRHNGVNYAIKVDADTPYRFEGTITHPHTGEEREQMWNLNTVVAYVKPTDFEGLNREINRTLEQMGLESAAYKDAFDADVQQDFGGTYKREGRIATK